MPCCLLGEFHHHLGGGSVRDGFCGVVLPTVLAGAEVGPAASPLREMCLSPRACLMVPGSVSLGVDARTSPPLTILGIATSVSVARLGADAGPHQVPSHPTDLPPWRYPASGGVGQESLQHTWQYGTEACISRAAAATLRQWNCSGPGRPIFGVGHQSKSCSRAPRAGPESIHCDRWIRGGGRTCSHPESRARFAVGAARVAVCTWPPRERSRCRVAAPQAPD